MTDPEDSPKELLAAGLARVPEVNRKLEESERRARWLRGLRVEDKLDQFLAALLEGK